MVGVAGKRRSAIACAMSLMRLESSGPVREMSTSAEAAAAVPQVFRQDRRGGRRRRDREGARGHGRGPRSPRESGRTPHRAARATPERRRAAAEGLAAETAAATSTSRRRQGPVGGHQGHTGHQGRSAERVMVGADVRAGVADVEDRTGPRGQFLGWCEGRGLRIEAVSPLHVAAYIRTHPGSAPTVKQHLAAIRMLCDWLVVSQVLPVNSAAAVRGPKHVVTKGATPVLSPVEARKLLVHARARLGVAAIAAQPHLDARPQRQPPAAEGEASRALERRAHPRHPGLGGVQPGRWGPRQVARRAHPQRVGLERQRDPARGPQMLEDPISSLVRGCPSTAPARSPAARYGLIRAPAAGGATGGMPSGRFDLSSSRTEYSPSPMRVIV